MKLSALTLAAALAALACSSSQGEPAEEPEAEASGSVLVQTAHVARGDIAQKIRAIGQVEFDAARVRTLAFLGAGQVGEVSVVAGEQVRKGQHIARLGALPAGGLEAQRARMNSEYARRELERVTRLRAQQLATNGELEAAQKGLLSANAELGSVGAGADAKGRDLEAPQDGVIVQVHVAPGEWVQAGQPALSLAPRDALSVRVGFDPEDALRLRPGLPVELTPLFARDGAKPLWATLARLHGVVDPATQRVEAVIRMPEGSAAEGSAGLFSGERVAVSLEPESNAAALVVPLAALTERDGAEGVFVVADAHAHWRPVQVGLRGEATVEAEAGLEDGDEVVVAGHSSLADGTEVRPETPDVAAEPKGEAEPAEPVPDDEKPGAKPAAEPEDEKPDTKPAAEPEDEKPDTKPAAAPDAKPRPTEAAAAERRGSE